MSGIIIILCTYHKRETSSAICFKLLITCMHKYRRKMNVSYLWQKNPSLVRGRLKSMLNWIVYRLCP